MVALGVAFVDVEVDDLGVVETEPALKKVDQHHCVVVGVAALAFTVAVPPMAVEGHADGAFPFGTDERIAARAVELLDYSLPGLLAGTQRLREREVEPEWIHGAIEDA